MKKSLVETRWGGLIVPFCVCLFFVGTTPIGTAAQIQQAHVSQVIQDVRLLESQGAPRPAAVNDTVTQQTGVRTGAESRAELTFTDLTIMRLGANTIFSFKRGARELDLTSGAILLEVPPDKAPVKVSTVAVTAASDGRDGSFGHGPAHEIHGLGRDRNVLSHWSS